MTQFKEITTDVVFEANPDSPIDLEECSCILVVAKNVMRVSRPAAESGRIERNAEKLNSVFLAVAAVGMLILILLAIVNLRWHTMTIVMVAKWLAVIIQLLGLLSLVAMLGAQAAYFWRTRRATLSPLIKHAQTDIALYAPFVATLSEFRATNLYYVAEHLSWQQEAFDRRRHALTGPVERIGLIPLAVAAITTAPKIFSALQAIGPSSLVWSVAGVAACFYIFVWVTWSHSTKLERTAWLLRWVADQKTTDQPNASEPDAQLTLPQQR